MNVSLFLRNIDFTSEVDTTALDEVSRTVERIRAGWPADTIEILQSKNPDLLKILQRTESEIGSLVTITNKPPQIRKEFRKTLSELERVGSLCGIYAKRHTKIG